MADRYQDRPYPADPAYDPTPKVARESDPLAELARLIGQTDPFGTGRAAQQSQAPAPAPDPYQYDEQYADQAEPIEDDTPDLSGPPPWLSRAAHHEDMPTAQERPSAVHPLQRFAMSRATPLPVDYEPSYQPAPEPADHSRYDDALYGPLEGAEHEDDDAAYQDDAYAYADYAEPAEERGSKRRGGILVVASVLALGLLGTGGAYAYRTFMVSHRSGEPPIIKADATPTKVVPASADGPAKVPDRMVSGGDGAEKIVPREEAPVDVNAKSGGARVVFPPLTPNTNPPAGVAVATIGAPPSAPTLPGQPGNNGTLPNTEPRKIRTLSVRGDQPDTASVPVGTQPAQQQAAARPVAAPKAAVAPAAPSVPRSSPASANASANAPLSLAPQGAAPVAAEPRTRVANVNPAQVAPSSGGGGYVVQVSSQRNEADAQASYRALQGKFPSVLGSHAPLIKRADLGDKGVYYRAMVGPFGSPEEAAQFCGNLKTAGGQCVVQKN